MIFSMYDSLPIYVMNKYNSYKNSGIFWVNEMPSHWKETKLKHVLSKLSRVKQPNAELLVCSNKGKVVKRGDSKLGLVAESDEIYQGVCKNDLLIHGMDTWHGAIAISDYDGMCTPVVHVCESKQDKHYIAYYLQFMAQANVFKLISNGIRQNTSDFRSWDKVGAIPITLPNISEQHAIVNYLKDKTLKIDQYVAARERERELLDSLKQSEIANIVTKGLNPNAPMKDSGIPWIGLIPKHWEVKRLRNFLKLVSEKGHGDMTLLSVTREQGVIERNVESKEENHNFIPDDLNNYKLVKRGQFVINKMKSWQGSYGVSSYDGIVSPAYYVCELSFPCKDFFSLAIRSKSYIPFFTQYSKGIRVDQWDLSPIGLKSIPFVVPPLSEQQAIVAYINEKISKIDSCLADLQAEIDYLKEFKQRLISDAVTGQICVAEPQKGDKQ